MIHTTNILAFMYFVISDSECPPAVTDLEAIALVLDLDDVMDTVIESTMSSKCQ